MKKLDALERKLSNINANLINIIIFMLGIILILASILTGGTKTISQVGLSIGTSLVASSIVVFISSRYLMKENNIKDMVRQWKIAGIFETRASMNKSTNIDLENNKDCLDIIAFGLKGFRDSKTKLIQEKVRQGMKIRILTINPESEFLKEREVAEKEIPGQMRNTIIQLGEWVNELKKVQVDKQQVQIKYYDSLPLDFYFGLDNNVYIGPYLYGKQSQQTISYQFEEGGEGFNLYKDYFEQLWNDNCFCKECY